VRARGGPGFALVKTVSGDRMVDVVERGLLRLRSRRPHSAPIRIRGG